MGLNASKIADGEISGPYADTELADASIAAAATAITFLEHYLP